MAKKNTSQNNRPKTRYQKIVDTLVSDISHGRYTIGEKLPTESELCIKFKVSRHTVREALRRLNELGLVERRRGSGTIVKILEPTKKYVQALSNVGEFLKYPEDTELSVLNVEDIIVGSSLSKKLGCKTNSKWSRIRCIRKTKAEVPICLVEIYVKPKFSSVEKLIGHDDTPVYALIERHFNQTAGKVDIELYADTITEEGVKQLKVEPNSPALVVIRRYSDPPHSYFEISIIEHPSGRFIYSMELEQKWVTGRTLK
ncbi:MAG: hypothetical protein CMM30_02320 [Rhodospirillaceae bacterium]|nr:hypothetical protein [Rhodospirillaceae bacterium]|tara:strand:- start:6516 stop:7286 length:771 start_codon:yes stop_codon:yes gene_type:complete